MFETTCPSGFLDYYRIPYAVVPDAPEPDRAWPAGLGRLRSPAHDGRPERTLLWPRATGAVPHGVLGRYRLGGSWLPGRVVPDTVARHWWAGPESGWRPIQQLYDEAGTPVASVWRDLQGNVFVPFDIDEVMGNFWSERYRSVAGSPSPAARTLLLRGFYGVKPFVPRPAQLALRRSVAPWQGRRTFPRWPVEDSLHDLYAWLLATLAELRGGPVSWLDMWPGGRSWALVLTHDVESAVGYRNLHLLRDPERKAGYRSSWNFVPERYPIEDSVLQELRDDGCEIGVHGLRHDGRDLSSRRTFDERLPAVRAVAERWGAVGYRSPATLRRWDWMPDLGFDYDSSYTDTDPYEPQPGGCCSYLPFFNRDMVELPITLPQDHTLFAILGRTDGSLWMDKARHLRDRGGMALVLAHPDYAHEPHLADAWNRLLEEFRDDDSAWRALPREVAAWWRRRSASTIEATADGWTVRGPAAGEASVRVRLPDVPSLDLAPAAAASGPATKGRHVLIVVENIPLAADHRVRKQVQDLLVAGYRVSVVTRADPANEAYRRWPGLSVLEYPSPAEPASLLGYFREYAVSFWWAALRSGTARLHGPIDVLQLCQPPDIYFPLARVHKLLGASVLIDQRDLMPELFALRQDRPVRAVTAALGWLERRTQRAADEAICTNGYQKARLIGVGASPDRVGIVWNGPVLERVERAAADPSLRDGRSFLCCWLGKMGRQDRVDLALRAIAHLVHDLGEKDVAFVFLGDGECLAEARALALGLGVDPWVSFTGWVPESEVFSHLASADLGLDASMQEDVSPVKVFEYMAFGLPFVSFDMQETRTIGADAGVFVPPGDVEALARALQELLRDPDRRAEMGRVGRERIGQSLAWEHQTTRYLEVVDRLSARAARRRRDHAPAGGA